MSTKKKIVRVRPDEKVRYAVQKTNDLIILKETRRWKLASYNEIGAGNELI